MAELYCCLSTTLLGEMDKATERATDIIEATTPDESDEGVL